MPGETMRGAELSLEQQWVIGELVGGGGFGQVYEADNGGPQAVAKFVPKAPGSDRELLFVDLPEDVANVVPVIDSGEHGDFWVLVMPRAEGSLRTHLDTATEPFDTSEVLEILIDISEALVSLEGQVVHRDIKPENVLLLGGHWCLADFGIARYTEASTAPDTQKFALSPPYAAPERWRYETATTATDIYSAGVIAFEMVSGQPPFMGPTIEEFREQHLHGSPPPLVGAPVALEALIEECMDKAQEARPSAANLRARLQRAHDTPSGPGLASLGEVNRATAAQRAEQERNRSRHQTAAERRSALAGAGRASFSRISETLKAAIQTAAPIAELDSGPNASWGIRLGEAQLTMSSPRDHDSGAWEDWEPPSFDVILSSQLSLRIPAGRNEYEGRSHSLWYCDATTEGDFRWFETAFMISPMVPKRGRQNPFALDPSEESAKALWSGMAEFQVAWPFTEFNIDDLDEFIDRWAGWLSNAARGTMGHPSRMPEKDGSESSFRRN